MPDTKVTSESTSGPFETYQTSLREMKEEAAQARKTADALDAEVREVTDALETEVRESANALERLEEAIPQWGRMCELTARNIPYEPIQTWQEQAREVLESAQSDFFSGTVSRVQKGTEKVHNLLSELRSIQNKVTKKIKEKEKIIDRKKSEKSKIEDYLEKSKNSIGRKKVSLRNKSTGFAIAAFIVGSLGGCAFGAVGPSQPSGMDGLIFGSPSAVLVWILTYFVGKSNIDKDKLSDLKKKKNKTEESIVRMEEEMGKLKDVRTKINIRT